MQDSYEATKYYKIMREYEGSLTIEHLKEMADYLFNSKVVKYRDDNEVLSIEVFDDSNTLSFKVVSSAHVKFTTGIGGFVNLIDKIGIPFLNLARIKYNGVLLDEISKEEFWEQTLKYKKR